MPRKQRSTKRSSVKPRNVSLPEFWENIYNQGNPGWDLGKTTPVLKKWLAENRGNGEKVCILGAGNGYDALAFAKAGYKVVAVDFSPTALINLGTKAKKSKLHLDVMGQDMFSLPKKMSGKFDLVFEYTTYCAIDPQRRDEYVALIKRLLKRAGRLVALFFPMGQDPKVGPPFGISSDEITERFGHSFHFESKEWPELSAPSRKLRELFVVMERK